jgi:hypothetical protein
MTVALVSALAQVQQTPQIVTDMTPGAIKEAIKAGQANPRISFGAIAATSLGMTSVVCPGTFSTPFLRVAVAAARAKTEFRKFSETDVTPEMAAPEVQIYAEPLTVGASTYNVTAIVITPRKGTRDEKEAQAIHPTKFEDVPVSIQNLYGMKTEGTGRFATFPLSVLTKDNEVHIVREGGRDCHAPFQLKNVR